MRTVKLVAVTAAACIFLALIAIIPTRILFDGAEGYVFYTGNTSKNYKEVASENPSATRLTLFNISGECASYDEVDLDELLKRFNGKVVFTEELDDSINYYCKADLPYSVNLYGEEINLHVCYRPDGVKVASPIIFGGY